MFEDIKLIAGQYKRPVRIEYKENRMYFRFGFNRSLMAEIKCMKGARWHGYDEKNPRKVWSVLDCPRNRFQLDYLKGNNPYEHYDLPLLDYKPKRSLYDHQISMVIHMITRKHCIIAGEMGTGKTLAGIEVMEYSKTPNWWWVAPRSALKSVELEFIKWDSLVYPTLMTYEGLKSIVKNWCDGDPAPLGIIFDESSRVKNATAQRSQAALYVADAIRAEHGYGGYIIEMTGSPAPKSPVDWHHQCEIACPGYLKEGHPMSFKKRLGLIVEKESISGGIYPHLVTWRDDPRKCNECGELKEDVVHNIVSPDSHPFVPSIDEVGNLYKRMCGLVLVILKKDCLDLPDKIYRIIDCPPTKSTIRAAKLLTIKAKSTIQALTLLRELSDGFQYKEKVNGTQTCESCNGKKTLIINEETVACTNCKGIGVTEKIEREAVQVPCPKEDALIDLLDEHDEIGRIIIYAGFKGSVDRITKICTTQNWVVLQVDGRGWKVFGSELDSDTLLQAMDLSHKNRMEYLNDIPRLTFVGNPQSGGMGITLTASPSIVYYSNDFNAESRIQSEDRIHRQGMDVNRGATIIDLFHLESDKYVLDNLTMKRTLQSRSLGELQEMFK